MERKLIRFAKVHGYLTVAIMFCSEILMFITFVEPRSHSNQIWLVFALMLLWTLNTGIIIMGMIQEDASCLRLAKHVYIVLSIAGFMLFGPILGNALVTLYTFYVLHFLQELFEDLNKKQDQGTIILTTIVYGGNQPATAAPLEQSQPEHNQSVSLPPSYETAVSMSTSSEQPKEFPTWT